MEYKVGSLADLISGTHDAASGNRNIMFVPIGKQNTTPKAIALRNPQSTSPGKKSRTMSDPLASQSKAKKRKLEYSRMNTEREADYQEEEPVSDTPHVQPQKVRIRDEEEESRTIFVKNVPYSTDLKALKKKFVKYGPIESLRFRCAPQGDTRVPKKVAVITKDFHPERTNISAFVRFKELNSVKKALKANGSLIEGHHIFVDRAVKEQKHDQNKAIFLGNIPFGAEENEIWSIFEKCGEIIDIRIVRDKQTGMGKGFAFVNFTSADAVELAVTLHGVKLRENELRVFRAVKKPTAQQRHKGMVSRERAGRNGMQGGDMAMKKKPNNNNRKYNGIPHVKEIKFRNKERMTRRAGNQFESDEQNKGQKKSRHASTGSAKQVPSQQFQGQKITDKKKKKKKLNKNELRKKIIAKKLTSVGKKGGTLS